MKLNSSIVPLRRGASASLERANNPRMKDSVVLSLISPFGRTKLEVIAPINFRCIPKDGFAADEFITAVEPSEKIYPFHYTFETVWKILLEFSIDRLGSTYPHTALATFEIPAERWSEFFVPRP